MIDAWSVDFKHATILYCAVLVFPQQNVARKFFGTEAAAYDTSKDGEDEPRRSETIVIHPCRYTHTHTIGFDSKQTPEKKSYRIDMYTMCFTLFGSPVFSKGRLNWDIMISLFVLYSVIAIPYRLAYFFEDWNDDDSDRRGGMSALDVFDIIVDVIFLMDVALNFFTGEYTHRPADRQIAKLVDSKGCDMDE